LEINWSFLLSDARDVSFLQLLHRGTPEEIRALAAFFTARGQVELYASLVEEGLQKRQEVLGMDHPLTLDMHLSFAHVLIGRNPVSRAIEETNALIPIASRVLGPQNRLTLEARLAQAIALDRAGRGEQAEDCYWDLIQVAREALGEPNRYQLHSLYYLGKRHFNARLFEEAEQECREVVEAVEELEVDEWEFTGARLYLGLALLELEDCEEAVIHLARAFEIIRSSLGEEHPRTRSALDSLIRCHRELGEDLEVERLSSLQR
jgi:tetratricopeptide (TPR) repeat protein